MKKINKKIFALCSLLFALTNCADLDIPPKNMITEDVVLSNEAGLEIYLARMYSNMPFEEFKYTNEWGFEWNSWLGALDIAGDGNALNRDGLCQSFRGEQTPYWGMAFSLIRDANHLIENLPKYADKFPAITYNDYLGEAYFVRAFAFYTMAKRFGGIPLVTKEIQYPADQDGLEVQRSSEEDTWNQILADFDKAAELMKPKSLKTGYANRFVALSYKAEAMLYAGCVAKYNETVSGRLTGFGQKTGVRVIGFAQDTWQAASQKYFTEAYKAARRVMTEGGYSLYKKKWAAGDRDAQYQNMVDMFSDLTSPENIFVRQYKYPTITHGIDAYSSPLLWHYPLSGGTCPTLDFVELFDGFDRYPNGTIRVTTGNSNTDGEYLLYNTPMDFFANAEPRLRAYVIFPSDVFRGKEIEMYMGTYTGSTPISPILADYSYAAAETRYQQSAKAVTDKTLFLSPRDGAQQVLVPYDKNNNGVLDKGDSITASGANGPFFDYGEASLSGFYLRKYLNPDPAFVPDEGKSDQPFILMRYADVLLIAAEAATELTMAGITSVEGFASDNLLQVATDNINAIRERAGANLLVGNITSDETGRNIVRKERRKELAFEHKAKWDLRRWRVQHDETRDDFWGETRDKSLFSSSNRYRFRGLFPFFSTQARKYFFDAAFQQTALKTFEYNVIDYYFAIPGGEVSKSKVIDQQPNR